MENTEKEFVVTLDMLWDTLKAALIWIIIAALVLGGAALAFSLATYTPVYTTTVSFYLVNTEYQDTAQNAGQQYNNVLLAHASAADCVYMLTLDEVKNTAYEQAGVANADDVTLKVDMPTSEKSCIISIHATAKSPEVAYALANAVFDDGKALVKEASNLDMNIISHGEIAKSPSNSRVSAFVFVAAFLGAAAVYLTFLLYRLFNSKITTPADAESALGVSVLGVVPNREKAEGKRYGKYYGKYGNGV